jgi:hypothetical protein
LYVGNRSDRTSPEESNYVKAIQDLYRQLFRPVPEEKQVVSAVDMEGYNLLKDYSYLQDGTRLDHTLVLQVDEFWAESHSSLYDLTDYMKRPVQDTKDPSIQEIEDVYRVYQEWDGDGGAEPKATTTAGAGEGGAPGEEPRGEELKDSRLSRFSTGSNDYQLDQAIKKHRIEKVPYLWDFGFLLCNRQTWFEASKGPRTLRWGTGGATVEVGDLWKALSIYDIETGKVMGEYEADPRKTPSGMITAKGAMGEQKCPVEWPEFLLALQQLKHREEEVVFDVDLRTEQALACFILEVWFSVVFSRGLDPKGNPQKKAGRQISRWLSTEGAGQLAEDRSETYRQYGSLMHLICNYPEDLWRSLSLVYWFAPNLVVEDFGFVTKPADPSVLCARHWYSTSSDPRYNDGARVPMRLPGHYSCRGDWFLAIAKGSRSPRLGEHAIDLLCSRRSNLTRLLEGIGLPTREVYEAAEGQVGGRASLRTALVSPSTPKVAGKNTLSDLVYYHDLRRLRGHKVHEDPKESHHFYSLWRSTIYGYDVHTRAWLRWLARIWGEGRQQLLSLEELKLEDLKTVAVTVDEKKKRFKEQLALLRTMLKGASKAAIAGHRQVRERQERFKEMLGAESQPW